MPLTSALCSKIVYLAGFNLEKKLSFNVAVVDLNKSNEYKARFENLCMSAAFKQSCIDSIIFSKDKEVIKANLMDKNDYYREKEIFESKTISFN